MLVRSQVEDRVSTTSIVSSSKRPWCTSDDNKAVSFLVHGERYVDAQANLWGNVDLSVVQLGVLNSSDQHAHRGALHTEMMKLLILVAFYRWKSGLLTR